jgi:hypothetical protein
MRYSIKWVTGVGSCWRFGISWASWFIKASFSASGMLSDQECQP